MHGNEYCKCGTSNFVVHFGLVLTQLFGARGGVVVKALRYKPAGREFDSRWCH